MLVLSRLGNSAQRPISGRQFGPPLAKSSEPLKVPQHFDLILGQLDVQRSKVLPHVVE
jgi:hypothetical protein